ncbi:hypothetical protein, partial [Klebsiella pneumoniae]|uniref:hypothetical protein n=1 Tax=Klebsiella pneumoniae TaxID=573 RepID=UPI001E448302
QWIISGANGKRYSSQFVWLLCLFLSHARTRLAKSNFLTTNLMTLTIRPVGSFEIIKKTLLYLIEILDSILPSKIV